MTREERLVDAARYALRVLSGKTHGLHDQILAGRQLLTALESYDDIEPLHDADRQAARVGRSA